MSNVNVPFVEAKPGDPITAGKWNDLQTKVRAELHVHGHTGDWKDGLFDGEPIGRAGIQDRAINGAKVDPASQLSVAKLDVDAVTVGRTGVGSVLVRGDKAFVEIGAGQVKQGDAGKIAYQGFSSGLDIVGAGTTGTNRRITLWSEGGGVHKGPLSVEGALSATSGSFAGALSAGGPLQVTGGNGDLGATEGDLRVGNDSYRLKIGVALGGGGAGDVRMRAVGGSNRLFIGGGAADTLTVTSADLTVAGTLNVNVPGAHASWTRFAVTAESFWGDGNKHVHIGAGGGSGIMFYNPHVSWYAPESRASIRYGRTGGAPGKTWWDVGVRADGGFGFSASEDGGAGEQVKISKAGALNANAGLVVGDGNLGAHIDKDGALYRASGQVYLTVDDNFYVRDTDGGERFRFETGPGTLWMDGDLRIRNAETFRARDALNLIRFGNSSDTDYQVLHKASGYWSRPTLGVHTHSSHAFGVYSSGWDCLLEVQGGTGNTYVKGAVYAGGSDIYFTQTNHNHSGIGNTTGYAAIENAANYGALMILGRSTAAGRIVKVWDELDVQGRLRIGAWTIVASGAGLYFQYNGANAARIGADRDKIQLYRNSNGAVPYFYYNNEGGYGEYRG